MCWCDIRVRLATRVEEEKGMAEGGRRRVIKMLMIDVRAGEDCVPSHTALPPSFPLHFACYNSGTAVLMPAPSDIRSW